MHITQIFESKSYMLTWKVFLLPTWRNWKQTWQRQLQIQQTEHNSRFVVGDLPAPNDQTDRDSLLYA